MEKKIELKAVGQYNGHQAKPSGSVDLNIVCEYSELTNTIPMLQLLNNDINLAVKKAGEKPFKLGIFRLQQINFDHDGQAKIKFNSTNDFVEIDNLNKLIPMEKGERFTIKLNSVVELEDETDED